MKFRIEGLVEWLSGSVVERGYRVEGGNRAVG